MGNKNILFIGHPEAGRRSAMFSSVLESCRRRGIHAELYVRDLLERLPDLPQSKLKKYVPAERIQTHPEARVVKPK